MKEHLNKVSFQDVKQEENNASQHSLVEGAMVFFNIFLMVCVSLYWVNPEVHQYFSGKPL